MQDPNTRRAYWQERKAASRRKLIEQGGKQITIPLDASTVAALARLRASNGFGSDVETIAWAIERACLAQIADVENQ